MRRALATALEGGAVAVVVLIAAAALAHGIAAASGLRPIVIAGGSMAPAITEGSLVFVGRPGSAEPLLDDVVAYRGRNGAIVTHRVVREAEVHGAPVLETHGDANTDPDPVLVDRRALIGRVTVALPYAGYVVRVIGQPAGWVTIVAAVLAAWLAADLLRAATERPRLVAGGRLA